MEIKSYLVSSGRIESIEDFQGDPSKKNNQKEKEKKELKNLVEYSESSDTLSQGFNSVGKFSVNRRDDEGLGLNSVGKHSIIKSDNEEPPLQKKTNVDQ